jgi:hypothetical protein
MIIIVTSSWRWEGEKSLLTWRTPKLLDKLNCKSKVKIVEGSRVGAHSLVRSTFGVEGHAKAPRWGLRKVTSNSIIHMDLHKPNDKLVSVQLEHLWCMDKP